MSASICRRKGGTLILLKTLEDNCQRHKRDWQGTGLPCPEAASFPSAEKQRFLFKTGAMHAGSGLVSYFLGGYALILVDALEMIIRWILYVFSYSSAAAKQATPSSRSLI
jgi:hypothetical protein